MPSSKKAATSPIRKFSLTLRGSTACYQRGKKTSKSAFEDLRAGQAHGVIGSPHFFLTSGSVFCPTLRISRDDGHLRITIDEESMQNFFAEALNP